MSRILFTGAPGAGKTTLLDALAAQGFTVAPELARALLVDSPLPLAGARRCRQLAHAELARHRPPPADLVLHDRGLLDAWVVQQAGGQRPAPALTRALQQQRYRLVLFFPHWPAIYRRDAQRRQWPSAARASATALWQACQHWGYRPLSVPCLPPAARLRWVLAQLHGVESGPGQCP